MNQQQFEDIFNKLTSRRREVLEQLLLSESDAMIADSMGITQTTVRKHIERICEEFGLGNNSQDGRRYRRSELVTLFAQYKPELLSDCNFGNKKASTVVETAKTENTGISESVSQLESRLDELKSLLFQGFLAREPAAEMLNQEFQIYNEQEKLQKAKILNKLGYNSYLEGNFKTALFYLEWAIRFNPEMGKAYYNLGLTYERLGEFTKACYHYEMAMQQSNLAADSAKNNLACLKIRQKDFQLAIELIQPILEQTKYTEVKVSLYKNLGWAYYELKLYEQAKENLLKSLEFKHDYAPAYYLLGKIQEIIDDKESTLSYFKKFLEYDGNEHKSKVKEWRLPELDSWRFEIIKYLKAYNI